ncbi:MAG: EF-P beta-lysylation protein EpmB [Thermoguttaceae bacterium]
MTTSLPATDWRTAAGDCRWQTVLDEAVTDPDLLGRLLDLPAGGIRDAQEAAGGFPLLVPRPYLDRIRPGDPDDPLLRQVWPISAELETAQGFSRDPLCETAASSTPGLLTRYRGRSLIVATGRCGVHCRFCFRRHHKTPSPAGNRGRLRESLEVLRRDVSIHEVILSGGDPLTLDDETLGELAGQLAAIEHLQRLRLHTRMPIVVPQRITGELLRWCRATRLAVVMVLHVNHPAEIDGAVAEALGRLVDRGIPLLSQTVLLRGVNDSCQLLAELFERLVQLRVFPYYLHQLDRVAGSAHFEVPEEEGAALVRELRDRLPGYAVPRYVRDIPGNRSKRVLA